MPSKDNISFYSTNSIYHEQVNYVRNVFQLINEYSTRSMNPLTNLDTPFLLCLILLVV